MKNIKVILMAITTLAVCAGCSKKAPQARQAVPDDVYVATPIIKPIEIWDEFTARIDAVKSVEVRARVSGYLAKINFSEGQMVKQGDLLFVIDPRPYEAAVASAKANIAEVEARLALAKSNLERARSMYKATVVSKEVFETRGAEVLSAQASLAAAKAKLRDAELNLEFTHIRAPISGRVSEALIDAGNLVTANSTLLTSIVKSDIVQAYFEASEQDIVKYQKAGLFNKIDQVKLTGPEAEVHVMTNQDKIFKGKVTYFDNRMAKTTSSLTMRADIDNKEELLKVGMFAKLRMKVADAKETMLVREDVIGTDLINRFVYVVDKDNKVVYKALKIGELMGKFRIVEGGLNKDDKVVVKALHAAVAGRVVKPIDSTMDAE
ncbi:MAG: efflux RND transporter periplasmic adaptor subunit [Verrucomicrobiaceae bacterium]|nr:efflux RND transporter periplasmic adaptor subunit [Verrucomicrobiaceae bacterium]